MADNLYDRAITQMRSAYRSAFNNVRRTAGKSTDRDVMFYESMRPEDFDLLVQDPEVGPDPVLDYIREMEMRRMKGG